MFTLIPILVDGLEHDFYLLGMSSSQLTVISSFPDGFRVLPPVQCSSAGISLTCLHPDSIPKVHSQEASTLVFFERPAFQRRFKMEILKKLHSSIMFPRCSMVLVYLHDWVIYGENVGKYTSIMEHLGSIILSIMQCDAP